MNCYMLPLQSHSKRRESSLTLAESLTCWNWFLGIPGWQVLSIHKALSIQAHPDKQRAAKLHAATWSRGWALWDSRQGCFGWLQNTGAGSADSCLWHFVGLCCSKNWGISYKRNSTGDSTSSFSERMGDAQVIQKRRRNQIIHRSIQLNSSFKGWDYGLMVEGFCYSIPFDKSSCNINIQYWVRLVKKTLLVLPLFTSRI